MISKKNRLKLKNQFDGSIVFSGREFDDRTGRTLHMANCENIIDDKLINEKTGLIKDEYVFNRRCPLCNEPDKHETIFVKQGFNHAKCVKCGFVFVNNPFNEGILHDKYEKEDSWSEVLLNDINIDMDTKKFKYGLMLIESVFDDYKLQLNKNLLDVGSGSGLFLKVARDNGWNVKGIEFNEKTRNFSENEFGLEVVNELIENLTNDEKYGVVSLWNVLEHIVEAGGFVKQIYNRLQDSGLFFISVPNADCLSTIIRKEKSNTFLGSSHVNFFNIDYLNKMVEKEGFKLIHTETYVTEHNNIKEYLTMFYENERIADFINMLTPEMIDDNFLGSKLIAIYKKI